MRTLGRHLIVEYAECEHDVLNDVHAIERYMKEAVRKSGATLVRSVFHRYAPQGVSGVVVIAESHMSVHTWPEYGYAAVDFFTCGNSVDPLKAHAYLEDMLGSRKTQVTELRRGIPSETDEVIRHKTVPTGA
jgi:S-adenosylmethionine decarboxylase